MSGEPIEIRVTRFPYDEPLASPENSGSKTPAASTVDFKARILGQWHGEKYFTTYREDGTYSMNPIAPDSGPPRPDGTWKIDGAILTKTYPDKPTTLYTILSLTSEKLTIRDAGGNIYTQDR